LKTWYIPKIKETRKYQKEIAEELERIRQDAELLPSMFREEAVFRNQCKRDKDDAEVRMNVLLSYNSEIGSVEAVERGRKRKE